MNSSQKKRFRRRRFVPMVCVLLGMFAVLTTACNYVPEDVDHSPRCSTPGSASAAHSAAVPKSTDYKTSSYTFTVEGLPYSKDDGSVQAALWKVTVSLGPWLQGSDHAGLTNAWHQVSENDDAMPLVSGAYGWMIEVIEAGKSFDLELAGNRWGCLDSERAAYIFGTVTFEDATVSSGILPQGTARPSYPPYDEIGSLSLQLYAGPDKTKIDELFGCYQRLCGMATDRAPQEVAQTILPFQRSSNRKLGPGPHPFVVAVPGAANSESGSKESLVSGSVFSLSADAGQIQPSGHDGRDGSDIPTQLGW